MYVFSERAGGSFLWSCPHIETSQSICTENQLTVFFMSVTLIFNGLKECIKNVPDDKCQED